MGGELVDWLGRCQVWWLGGLGVGWEVGRLGERFVFWLRARFGDGWLVGWMGGWVVE